MKGVVLLVALVGCDEVFSIDHVDEPPANSVCLDDTCIDRTEVTRRAYASFLADSPVATGTGCSGNDLTPGGNWPPAPGEEDYPVVNVDWCDAFNYCAWAGRRLCGRRGGGPVAPNDAKKATHSQWYFACTGGAQDQAYPYGATFEAGRCNVDGVAVDGVEDHQDCVGGLPGLLDMSGNVYEWEDSCDGSGASDGCYVRGGDFSETADLATCDTAITQPRLENRYSRFGFRCCSDGT